MIRRVEVRGRDLEAAAKRESYPPPQTKPSQHQSRRDEILFLPVVLPILKERRVEFDFRPDPPEHPVLKRVVPGVGASDDIGIRGRQPDPERPL